MQAFAAFLNGLDDAGFDRVMRKMRRHSMIWPMSPAEEDAAGVGAPWPTQAHDERDQAKYDTHARVLAQLDEAREAWGAAHRNLEKAKHPHGANLYPQPDLTAAQEAEIDRRAEALDDARETFERALTAEVEARPHRAGRRRQHDAPTFGAIKKIVGKVMG